MQCKCGGNAPMRTHQVDTLGGAQRWWATAGRRDLPMTVIQWECDGCGRNKIELWSGKRRIWPTLVAPETDGRG